MGYNFFFNVNSFWREREAQLARVVADVIIGQHANVERKQGQGDGDWHLDINSNNFWLHRKESSKFDGENITKYEVNARLNYDFSQVRSLIISRLKVEKYN